MFDVQIDETTRMVRAHVEGLFTLDEVDRFNGALRTACLKAWDLYRVIRVLADAASAPVQTAEVTARFISPVQVLRGPDDRYAVIVGSALTKIQANRLLADDRARAFTDHREAELWVTARADATAAARPVSPDRQ